MRSLDRFCTTLTALAVFGAVTTSGVRADVPTAPPAPLTAPACRVVDGSLATPLDSKSARSGQIFHFTASPDEGQPSVDGLGVVDFVRGAARGGKFGEIGIELRYLRLPDGTHVPAMILPLKNEPAVYHGKTQKSPSVLGALSFVKGSGFHLAAGVIGVYNFVHSGSQAVVPVGTRLHIVLGDDYLTGACTFSLEKNVPPN